MPKCIFYFECVLHFPINFQILLQLYSILGLKCPPKWKKDVLQCPPLSHKKSCRHHRLAYFEVLTCRN